MSRDVDGRLRRVDLLAAAGLIAAAFAVFGAVRGHAFLVNWDDLTYVVENETVRGLSWANVVEAFRRPYFGNYAPLHILS